MSILINTVVAEAESKEKYLDIDILNRLRQDASEFQQRLNILNLITENYKLIINEAINSCVQINSSFKEIDSDQIALFTENLDTIFRFVTYSFLTRDDDILHSLELQKTYLESKDFLGCASEIMNSIKFLTIDYINNFSVKDNFEGDIIQHSSFIVELEYYFDKVILLLEEVKNNSENQPNQENHELQQESAPILNGINFPEKPELNIWQRGNRMIVFASGCSFIGGMFGQLPGALIGAIAGAVYGSILKLETDSPN